MFVTPERSSVAASFQHQVLTTGTQMSWTVLLIGSVTSWLRHARRQSDISGGSVLFSFFFLHFLVNDLGDNYIFSCKTYKLSRQSSSRWCLFIVNCFQSDLSKNGQLLPRRPTAPALRTTYFYALAGSNFNVSHFIIFNTRTGGGSENHTVWRGGGGI